jgi:hypothetical protein
MTSGELILSLIEIEALSAKELCEQSKLSMRTIHRQIKTLRAANMVFIKQYVRGATTPISYFMRGNEPDCKRLPRLNGKQRAKRFNKKNRLLLAMKQAQRTGRNNMFYQLGAI